MHRGRAWSRLRALPLHRAATFGLAPVSIGQTSPERNMRPFRNPTGPLRSLLFLLLGTTALQAQTMDRPTGFPAVCDQAEVQVMLLGTYHFANPGRDVIKQDIDDVLQPRRQAELEDLVSRLASWQPDRIAVEQPISRTDTVRARYARYLAKALPPNRNEVVQIGFRLASRLGHDAVYPIDDDSFLDLNDSLKAVEQRRPEFKRARDSLTAVLQKEAEATSAWMRTTT